MSTEFYNRNWRMPNSFNGSEDNNSKFSNYSIELDGSSEYINCGTDIGTSFGEDYTGAMAISIWFKTDITSGDDGIFQFTGSTALGEISAAIYANDLEIRIKGGLEASGSFTDTSNWHHLVINLLGPSAANQVYLDGVAFGSTFTYSSGGLDLNGETFNIGHYGGSRYFNGKLDHCCIFDYALSASQITALYGSSSTGVGNPMAITNGRKPVAYYPIGDYAAFNGSEYLVNNGALQDYVFDFVPNDYITCGNVLNQSGTDAFSVSGWIKYDTTKSNTIVGKMNSSFVGYQVYINAANKLKFLLQGTGSLSGTGATALSTNNWYHIVVTYDGSGASSGINFYINGDSETFTGSGSNSGGVSNSANFQIGARTGTADALDGQLSNVQIFNTALSATGSNSVETLYNNGTPLSDMSGFTSLQGWWKLDASATFDGSNWSIPDSSSNSNTGTSSGMTAANLVQSNLNILSPYSRYALDFDAASSDYIDLGSSNFGITATTAFSISAWINSTISGTKDILSKRETSGGYTGFTFRLNHSASKAGKVMIILDGTGGQAIATTNTDLNPNIWYNVILTSDGTGSGSGLKIYINGVDDTTGQSGTVTDISNSINTMIGSSAGLVSFFSGKIDEVAIFDYALTPKQIREDIFNASKQVGGVNKTADLNNNSNLTAPVAWYRMGD